MLKVDKITITEFLAPIRHLFGQDMGMAIDFEHGNQVPGSEIKRE